MRLFTPVLIVLCSCGTEEGVKVHNSTPTVTITSHSGGETFQDGYEVTFQAQVQDDNHEASSLSVEWSSNIRTLCSDIAPTSDGVSQCTVALEEGEITVRVQVTDPEASAAIAEINVGVEPTFAPTVEIVSPLEQSLYYSDQIILFSARILDSEDASSDLIYSWDSSLDGTLTTTATPNEDGLLEEYLYLTEGTHALTLTAIDLSGKSTEKSISLVVGGSNTTPSCGIELPEDGASFFLGETVIFKGTASDSEVLIDELDIMWTSDKDGELGSGVINSSGEISLSYAGLSANSHNIQLIVKDELESTCYDSTLITVGTAPELTLQNPLDGDIVKAGEFVQFQGTVADNEDLASTLQLTWISDIDGGFSTSGANSSGEIGFNVSTLSVGTHSITVTATDSAGLTDTKVLLLQVNQEPTMPIVELGPTPAKTSDVLSVIASASTDGDGDNITYAYEWYQNNSLTNNTSTIIQSIDTNRGDTWTVRVTPNDGYHNGAYAEASVVIVNSPPTIDVLILDASQATTTQTIVCTGTATDADGDPLSESHQWKNESTGVSLGSLSSQTLSPLSVSPGDSVSCTYTINDTTDSLSQVAVLAVINTEPTIDFISVVPSTPYLGDTLSCIGSISDEDLEVTSDTYLWENQTTSTVLSTDSSIVLDSSNASPNDIIACTLTTTDPSGGTDTAITTAIVGNLPPSIDSLSFDISDLAIGDIVTCLSSESDPEGDIPSMSYEWKNETSGVVIGSGAIITLTSSMATGLDEISCSAVATDNYGATDSESIYIFVEETIPEFLNEATISPNSGLNTSSSLSCTGVATDPDGTSVGLTYAWSVGSTTMGTTQSITLSPSIVQPTDVVECVITATDSAGEQATSTASVMIGNTAPTLSGLTITPSTGIDSNSALSCSVTVYDADLEPLTPTYTWKNGTTTLGSGAALTLDPSLVQPLDSVTCEASVTDGFGANQSDSVSVTVDNTAPTISSISIAPSVANNDSTLTCSVVAADADNQSMAITYQWSNDSDSASLGTTSTLTLNSTIASRTDVISCTATVTDSSGDSVVSSASVTMENRAPTLPTVVLDPSTAYVDSTLTCNASGSIDDDGDGISYRYDWTVNSGSVVETASTFSAGFVATDTVLCTVTPSDGLLDGTAGSASITISNSLPVVSSVILDPDPVYTDSVLTAHSVYSDLDGDTMSLTYTWSVGSSEVQSGANHTLADNFFSKGETVTVSVVANDGSHDSIEYTASIVVRNTIPTAPSIALTPTVPEEQVDDLICSLDGVSIDKDNDTLDYYFSWTVDGSTYTSAVDTTTNSTVSATDTNSEEEWECTITPNDGEADGSTVSASVTIESNWGVGSTDSYEWDNDWALQCTDWSGSMCRGLQIYVPSNECVDSGWWNLNYWHGPDMNNACDLFCEAMNLTVLGCHSDSPSSGSNPERRLVDIGETGCNANFPTGVQMTNISDWDGQNLSVTCSW